MKLTQSPFV